MKALSKVACGVHPSTTLAIDSMFKQMRAQGVDVIGFGAGEPDFNTPERIKEAGIAAIHDNKTKYTPAAGIMELRKAVCDRLKADCDLDYKPTQIVVASGAKHNVYIALRALCDPGDEVILPAPYWVSYYELICMVGATPVVLDSSAEESFKISPEKLAAAVTPKTKAIILNNPSNPTGMMYSKAELEALAKVCVEKDLYIISDEIYYCLAYDNLTFTSVASLGEEVKERTILINGVSKSYAMTGWRVGYAAASEPIAKVMANYLSHSTGAPSSVSQWAAVEAMKGPQEDVEEMRREFEARRDYIVERMSAIPGVSCIKPQGAFYVMMSVEQLIGRELGGVTIHNADDFAQAFLEKALVAVVPCSGFGSPNYVRWSYATSLGNIKEGLDRLEKFLVGAV